MEVFKNIFDNLGITEFARPSLGISDILDILIVAYIIYKIILQSNISKICVIHEICVHTYPNRQRSASSTFLTGWMVMLYFDLSSE